MSNNSYRLQLQGQHSQMFDTFEEALAEAGIAPWFEIMLQQCHRDECHYTMLIDQNKSRGVLR